MLSDIDSLMQERAIDALVISGSPKECKDLCYFTGPVAVSGAMVLKKRGASPVLLCISMERDEAAKSGLTLFTYSQLGYAEALKEAKTQFEASLTFLKKILQNFEISGRVAFYGKGDIPYNYTLLTELAKSGQIEVFAETENSIISEARMTKDESEIEKIAAVGRKAQEIMRSVMRFLKRQRARDGKLVHKNGTPVKIGEVKSLIDSEARKLSVLIEQPLIFSQGKDSAVPHSRGDDSADIVLGKTIVFDFCPYESGGYYFDITRTFCLGYVPENVQKIYADVLAAQKKILKRLKPGVPGSDFDDEISEFFEKRGYPTIRQDSNITRGYVHSLGHGIGLEIHERPRLSSTAKKRDVLSPGHVFTIEPGLYFPDEEIGVRIEDVVAFKTDGTVFNLSPFPKKLLIPVKEL
jgi:Xaa-Pro aminopeptidase